MKKATFNANAKEITMGKGNLDLFKSSPKFREKVQLFTDGINKMNDKRLEYSALIATTRNYLENVVLKSAVVSSTEVDELNAKIEDYKKAVSEITAEILSKMPEYDETDNNLYYAYRTYINGEEDTSTNNTYVRAFIEWLDNAGITPTQKGIAFIMSQIGVKKASAKQTCKSGGTIFTGELGKKQYLDLVYRTIGNMMYKANALKPYNYNYVIPEKVKVTK